MKILYINEFFTENIKTGANLIAFNTYYLSKEEGNECYFFANDEKEYLEEQIINKYFPISHINKKGIFNQLLYRFNSIYNYSAQRNLEKVLEKVKPDLVHVHAVMELSFSIILALRKYKVPYVITAHDALFVCPVMGTNYNACTLCSDNIFNCINNRCSHNNLLFSTYLAIRFFMNKFLIKQYLPHKIIAPSNALKKYIESTKYSNGVEIEYIPNSLDKCFHNLKPNFNNNGYFLFVGNLADNKGVNILLKAFKGLDKNIKLHIVGTGKKEEEYQQFVEKNCLTNVEFKGKLNREQIIEEYQNCIALITPSTWFEIFGLINIEAFANGKPVIASDIGGIADIVDNNINGLLFEPKNIEQLRKNILIYWNNPDLVIKHGRNAYQKANKQYNEIAYSEKLQALYKKVISEVKSEI